MAEFLTIELHTANLFVNLALAPCGLKNRVRYVQNARQAFDTVVQFALRAALNHTEVARVAEELDSVRSRLESLGEKNFGAESVLDSFPTASTAEKSPHELLNDACEQGRLPVKVLRRKAQRFKMQCRRVRTDCREMLAKNRALMKKKCGPNPEPRPTVNHLTD